MVVLRRLSPGPTIPDLMQAETEQLFAACRRLYVPCAKQHVLGSVLLAGSKLYLTSASVVLFTALQLVRCRMLGPRGAGNAFLATSRLSRQGLIYWSSYRKRAKAVEAIRRRCRDAGR